MRTYITRTMRSHMSSSPSPRYVCDLTSPRLHVFVCTYVCVCVYTGTSRAKAVKALRAANGDIVSAIMELTV